MTRDHGSEVDKGKHESSRLYDERQAFERTETTVRYEYSPVGGRGMGGTRLSRWWNGHKIDISRTGYREARPI